jgi:hypothetical protein
MKSGTYRPTRLSCSHGVDIFESVGLLSVGDGERVIGGRGYRISF